MITHLTEAMNYHNYCQFKKSEHYNDVVAGRIAKWIQKVDVQMMPAMFTAYDSISILSFLETLKAACDRSSTHKGGTMWLFRKYLKCQSKVWLQHRIKVAGRAGMMQQSSLTTYCHVVSYLLKTYAADDVIAEAVAGIVRFRQQDHMSLTSFAKSL